MPLVLFGGSVTTMRAGMAENGWLEPDGYFLWLYPWAMRVRDAGVFVEHHHRELGSLVGMLSVATAIATFVADRRLAARVMALVGVLAVGVQGVIGGLRVLENDPSLAFLHGALGQAVFAVLALVALILSPRWRDVPRGGWSSSPRLAPVALPTLALTCGQIVLGAWLRHGLGPLALILHGVGAVVVSLAIVGTARRFRRAAQAATDDRVASILGRSARLLLTLLVAQLVLGVASAVSIYFVSGGMTSATISPAEIVFSTLHVAVGALLLATLSGAAAWGLRLTNDPRPALDARLRTEGGIA